MKKFSILAIALFAALALSAVASSAAFAEVTQWLDNGAAITTAKEADSEAADVILKDSGTGGEVLCEGVTDKGTVGPGGADSVTSVTFTTAKCKGLAIISTVDNVTALNLPWTTQISGGLDLISAGTGGEPGYLIEGVTLLGLVDDSCTTNKGTTELANVTGGVNAIFPAVPAAAEKANCSIGGKEKGEVFGTDLNLLVNGDTLTVS
jgi:hypothetical protein